MTDSSTDLIPWRDWSATDALPHLAPPASSDDKYSRGVLGIMTGSPSYPGAAVLNVEAASRTGVGMVRYVGPGRAARLVLQRRPEAVSATGRVQAWLVGSGMDAAARSSRVTAALVEALSAGHPSVVDAGALDLASHATGPTVITPHAGELRTLLAARGVDVSRELIASHPAQWAERAAVLLGVTVLLKGHTTHVVGVTGSAGTALVTSRLRITAPTTELATAGSGDVLAGILGALLATNHGVLDADPTQLAPIAATAAWLHGAAGARASCGGPITALDVAEALPATIAALRGEH